MEPNIQQVKLWGKPVGQLQWDKKISLATFTYNPSFLQSGLDIAPINMSVHAPRTIRQMAWPGDNDRLYRGLPPLIADSLPDFWGDTIFRVWLKTHQVSIKKYSPLDQLALMGQGAMGALEFEPEKQNYLLESSPVHIGQLHVFTGKALAALKKPPYPEQNNPLWQDLLKISFPPGGRRPKAIVAINEATDEVISGQGNIPEGFQHYLIKYDHPAANLSVYPFAKLEYVYYQMALAVGIEMMPSKFGQYGNITLFMTRRFDRVGNQKIHTQTLAAMAPLIHNYEGIFEVMHRLNLPYEDSRQQFLRMVFNVITRNVDDHSKNFAFCMDQKGQWRLSPAYDLTFGVDLAAPPYANRHIFTINGKNEGIQRKDLEIVAEEYDIQDYPSLISQVAAAVERFEDFAKALDIDKKLIERIKDEFIRIE